MIKMNPQISILVLALSVLATQQVCALQHHLQATGWNPLLAGQPQQLADQQPQFASAAAAAAAEASINQPSHQLRQPIAADLQNQVNALSAQLAAANRQLEYFQQQLSLSQQPQAQPQPAPQLIQQAPQQAAQQFQQFQPAPQQQEQAQIQAQAQAQAHFFRPQQAAAQEAPRVSTLVDESDLAGQDPRFEHQPARVVFQQQQQRQFFLQNQNQPTSTTASPASIEPSPFASQPEQVAPKAPQMQAPPANMAPPHKPAANQDDKFSIGLGVLSPGYTQKFGNTALDFNQDKDGFSFTLSNNGHSNQVPKVNQQQQSASSSGSN